MQRYYNASQAARELNVPDKTIRRWLKQGLSGRWQLTAVRTESGQLAIATSDIERIKREREQDRMRFAKPAGLGMSNLDEGDLPKQVESLTQRVGELEKRIAELESTLSQQNMPNLDYQQPLGMPSPQPSSHPSSPKPQPHKSIVAPAEDDMLSARDFATKIGIEYTLLDGYARRGIAGEKMDVTEVPTTRKGYSRKYFNPTQQER